jgi:calcineurin-like phosphoesterase family protein
MIYFTADHHFFHKQIIKFCERPFKSEQAMRKALIINHNTVVNKNDTVYFIGDVAMLGTSQWESLKGVMSSLNGTKHLIFGNHDEFKWQRYLDIGFTTVHSALQLNIDGISFILAHDPSVYCAIGPESVLLCGHIHTLFKSLPDQRVVNVGVDQWDFKPITIDDVKKELKIP